MSRRPPPRPVSAGPRIIELEEEGLLLQQQHHQHHPAHPAAAAAASLHTYKDKDYNHNHNNSSSYTYDPKQNSSQRHWRRLLAHRRQLVWALVGVVIMVTVVRSWVLPFLLTQSPPVYEEIVDPAELPYILASNNKASLLAIGVISGPNEAQKRRVKLLQETWFTSLDPRRDGALVFSDGTDANVPAIGIPNTGSTWQGAQDRWLPALSYLYMALPLAQWYVLLDDDTFLIPANLKGMLAEQQDPGQPLYLGRTMFVEVQEGPLMHQTIPFAHGGSGVVLSAALLRVFGPLLMEVLQKKGKSGGGGGGEEKRCQGSGYGDGDLGICIKELLNIDVTHEACLHSLGPKAYEGMESDGLLANMERPCSFHYAFKRDEGKGKAGSVQQQQQQQERREQKERDEAQPAEGKGSKENDKAEDEQIRAWHRLYNVAQRGRS